MSEEQYAEPISAIEGYVNNTQIYWVEGTLIKLFAAKPNQHGSIQNGELQDADGGIMKITFADCDQPMTARGCFIELRSVQSQAHGYTGVKVKDDPTYGRCIWVTGSAQIAYPNGAPRQSAPPQRQGPPPRQQQQQGQPPRRPQSAPRTPPPPRQQTGGGGGAAPAPNQFEQIEKIVSCYMYVHRLVNEKIAEAIGSDIHDDLLRDLQSRATATVFVDVAKAGILTNWNPKLKVRQFPEPPADPSQWEICYIEQEGSALHGKTLKEISDADLLRLFKVFDDAKSNTKLAECVYQAAFDRRLLNEEGDVQPEQSNEEELKGPEIPF